MTPAASLSGKMTSGGFLNLLAMVDTDADGLPDWWENDFPNRTGTGARDDPDGDGVTNLQEFLNGASPAAAGGSQPGFSAFAFGSGSARNDFILSFQSFSDFTYQVEWSDSPEENSWQVLGPAVAGTGAVLQVTDPGAFSASSRRFYRLRLISK